MKETLNLSKLIKPNVDENGQTKLDFKSSERLLKILEEINDKYPLIREIIKDRISYHNGFFYISKEEMTEDELRLTIEKINEYEVAKKNDNTSMDKLYKDETKEERQLSQLYGRK